MDSDIDYHQIYYELVNSCSNGRIKSWRIMYILSKYTKVFTVYWFRWMKVVVHYRRSYHSRRVIIRGGRRGRGRNTNKVIFIVKDGNRRGIQRRGIGRGYNSGGRCSSSSNSSFCGGKNNKNNPIVENGRRGKINQKGKSC